MNREMLISVFIDLYLIKLIYFMYISMLIKILSCPHYPQKDILIYPLCQLVIVFVSYCEYLLLDCLPSYPS